MKDWDVGGSVPLVDYEREDFIAKVHNLHSSDARAGYACLSYEQCLEVNAACERFFQSRNMPYGNYYKQIPDFFFQKHENTDSTQHASKTGPVPEIPAEGGPGGSGGGAGHAD